MDNQYFPRDCPSCGDEIVRPDWNPYDGVWECPECGSDAIDADIPEGPTQAPFLFCNLNPDL